MGIENISSGTPPQLPPPPQNMGSEGAPAATPPPGEVLNTNPLRESAPLKPKADAGAIGANRAAKPDPAETQVDQENANAQAAGNNSTGQTMTAVGGTVATVGGIVAMLPIPVVAQVIGGIIAIVGAIVGAVGFGISSNTSNTAAAAKTGAETGQKTAEVMPKERPNLLATADAPSRGAAASMEAAVTP